METDLITRLVNLISIVAYAEGDECGLRKRATSAGAPELPEEVAVMAHTMCMYYADAVRYLRSGASEGHRDYVELPDFTLPFVTNATAADVEQHLGEIAIHALGMLDDTNARVIGRRWLDAVLQLCWDIKIAARTDEYGLE